MERDENNVSNATHEKYVTIMVMIIIVRTIIIFIGITVYQIFTMC